MADRLDNSAQFADDQGTRIAREPTGAGAEATEGIHGEPKGRDSERDETRRTSVADRESSGTQSGSEPLPESRQHRSGYGGDAGAPKGGSNVPPQEPR